MCWHPWVACLNPNCTNESQWTTKDNKRVVSGVVRRCVLQCPPPAQLNTVFRINRDIVREFCEDCMARFEAENPRQVESDTRNKIRRAQQQQQQFGAGSSHDTVLAQQQQQHHFSEVVRTSSVSMQQHEQQQQSHKVDSSGDEHTRQHAYMDIDTSNDQLLAEHLQQQLYGNHHEEWLTFLLPHELHEYEHSDNLNTMTPLAPSEEGDSPVISLPELLFNQQPLPLSDEVSALRHEQPPPVQITSSPQADSETTRSNTPANTPHSSRQVPSNDLAALDIVPNQTRFSRARPLSRIPSLDLLLGPGYSQRIAQEPRLEKPMLVFADIQLLRGRPPWMPQNTPCTRLPTGQFLPQKWITLSRDKIEKNLLLYYLQSLGIEDNTALTSPLLGEEMAGYIKRQLECVDANRSKRSMEHDYLTWTKKIEEVIPKGETWLPPERRSRDYRLSTLGTIAAAPTSQGVTNSDVYVGMANMLETDNNTFERVSRSSQSIPLVATASVPRGGSDARHSKGKERAVLRATSDKQLMPPPAIPPPKANAPRERYIDEEYNIKQTYLCCIRPSWYTGDTKVVTIATGQAILLQWAYLSVDDIEDRYKQIYTYCLQLEGNIMLHCPLLAESFSQYRARQWTYVRISHDIEYLLTEYEAWDESLHKLVPAGNAWLPSEVRLANHMDEELNEGCPRPSNKRVLRGQEKVPKAYPKQGWEKGMVWKYYEVELAEGRPFWLRAHHRCVLLRTGQVVPYHWIDQDAKTVSTNRLVFYNKGLLIEFNRILRVPLLGESRKQYRARQWKLRPKLSQVDFDKEFSHYLNNEIGRKPKAMFGVCWVWPDDRDERLRKLRNEI